MHPCVFDDELVSRRIAVGTRSFWTSQGRYLGPRQPRDQLRSRQQTAVLAPGQGRVCQLVDDLKCHERGHGCRIGSEIVERPPHSSIFCTYTVQPRARADTQLKILVAETSNISCWLQCVSTEELLLETSSTVVEGRYRSFAHYYSIAHVS